MVQSVLGSLVLGYRPLWNNVRRFAGIQLFVHQQGQAQVDAPHLLRTLREMWSASSPPLLLSPRSPQILANLLANAPAGSPSIEVNDAWLANPELLALARGAQRRGLILVWSGAFAHLPEPETAQLFRYSLLALSSRDAAATLAAGARAGTPRTSPLIAGQMYEGVHSRALAAQCLDAGGALAVAGWPDEDVLHSLRLQPLQPTHEVVRRVLKAIDQEESIDSLETLLGEDPLLAYRFMVYTNSAALGLRTGVDSLRRGLVMMGYGQIARWLAELLPHASTEPDLRPIRKSMVLRARLTDRLMDAGVGHDLRREVYMAGLFSRLDELLHEPLGQALRRLPLSERVYNACALGSGAYASSLQLAAALEGDHAPTIRALCEAHEVDLEHVNRSLLRVLADIYVVRPPAPGRRGHGALAP